MKRALCVILALCLLAAAALAEAWDAPDMAGESLNEFISQGIEAEVGEAQAASEDTGLTPEAGEMASEEIAAPADDSVFEEDAELYEIEMDEQDAPEDPPVGEEPMDVELPLPGEPEAAAEDLLSPEMAEAAAMLRLEEEFAIDANGAETDLFAGYVERLFYEDSGAPMATENTGAQLTGQNRVLYDALKPEILKVAAGERSSTRFDVPLISLLGKLRFTAEDLGVQLSYEADGSLSAASISAMWTAYQALYTYDISLVATALWYDCTYELYWLDRYKNGMTSTRRQAVLRHDGDLDQYYISLPEDAALTIGFPVLDLYAGDGFSVDTTLIDSAERAADTARSIVKKYADYTDYARLFGYAVEIAKLVDYNAAAANEGWDFTEQNPWKLIWVFDGDPSTNVVCEGYTQAFQYLCELSHFDNGIRCYQVDGDASGLHAWNVVRMDDGKSYVVDITWMDAELEQCEGGVGLAKCISDGKGKLFMVGAASGSVFSGYEVRYRSGGGTTLRTYTPQCRSLYPKSVLTLADSNYALTGFQKIGGNTYYYDSESRYVTGTLALETGMSYRFGTDGALTSGWSVGWHTINGKRYYFEATGLHAEHSFVTDGAVAPTCTQTGLTEGSHCKVCGEVLEAQQTLPALGHTWGEPAYQWSADHAACTATRACGRDAGHVETETARVTSQVSRAATCEAWGETAWRATFSNGAFRSQEASEVNLAPLGHAWGQPVYQWSADHAACTATRVCGRDAGHVETETVPATSWVSRAATCEAWGETTWRATFSNGAFQSQEASETNLAPLGHAWGQPVYEWSADHATCTATRACGRDAGHVETETARATSWVSRAATCEAWGETAWQATFSNGAFQPRVASEANLEPLGHAWGEPIYVWSADHAACTAARACERDAGHVQTETAQAIFQVTRAPTCEAQGEAICSATFANPVFEVQNCQVDLAPTGHTPEAIPAVAATDTAAGLTEGSRCAVCGQVLEEQQVVPKLATDVVVTKNRSAKATLGKKLQIVTNKAVKSYKSSNKKIVAVSKSGLVTPRAAGTAKITVTLKNKKTLTLTVKVTDPLAPKKVRIVRGASTVKAGKKLALSVTLNPVNAKTKLTWTSSDTRVATVSGKGVVKGKKPGTVTITVKTANGKQDKIKIKVTK